jgi:23S rRNA (guanosine2251-2'-O)-methyltransferase
LIQLEGRNPVEEALKTGKVMTIWIEKGKQNDSRIKKIHEIAIKKGVNVELVSNSIMDKKSKTGRHQGIIAIAFPVKELSLHQLLTESNSDICLLILDRIQDPQNLGAIIRTSEAAGVSGILISKKGSTRITETVHRVSMGGSLRIPLWKQGLYPVLKTLKQEGIRIVSVDPSGSIYHYEGDLTGPVAFIIGGEDKGVSPSLLKKSDEIIKIPMLGKIRTLNVSVATAIVLYERIRQKTERIDS